MNSELAFRRIAEALLVEYTSVYYVNAETEEERSAALKEHLRRVRAHVDEFVKDAEQFDDLTMLCLEYKGGATP